ncbi:hypothetical protein G3T14_22070 [Methylobacterium sp. BTF04]|uniref:hypothetical protein n=1 Tax=Methylobacterium sp. BTF04 TaxID=2708300 RepID=UPI0013CF5916|nr:hypothetical protein [Methylobacterium sp. BTF04]NEU14766.1 hypothetical protein [Methylobacterium sp. BTF04]
MTTSDLDTHKAILDRLKASQTVEDLALATCWGFQHLFEHVAEQSRKIAALTATLEEQRSSADRIAAGDFL